MSDQDRPRGPSPQRPGARKPRPVEPAWQQPREPEPEPEAVVARRAAGPRGLRPARPGRVDLARGSRPTPEAPSGASGSHRALIDDDVRGAHGSPRGRADTVLFDLAEARRELQEPEPAPLPQQTSALAWAGPGMGWEEPAGRELAPPPIERIARAEEPAAARPAGRVASAGGGQPRAGIAVAGVLAGGAAVERDDEEEPPTDGPDPGAAGAESERVASRRQLALLLAAAALFLIAGGALVMVYRARTAPSVEAAASEPTGAPAVAAPATAADPALAAPASPPPAAATPTQPPGSGSVAQGPKPPPATAPSGAPPKVTGAPPPSDRPTQPGVEAPSAPPPRKGPPPSGRLKISFAPGFGGGTISVECPGRERRSWPLAAPSTSLDALTEGCVARLKCNGQTSAIKAPQLVGAATATCSGCNSEQPQPVCR